MTVAEYWDGDAELPRFYRKAEEIRAEKRNQELWLQGMYVYEAIADIAPILQAFAKKGTKAKPYPSSPYPLTDKDRRIEHEAKQKAVYSKGKRYIEAIMANAKRKFPTKTEEPQGE